MNESTAISSANQVPDAPSLPVAAIGIDISDRTSHYCHLDVAGSILTEGTLATTPERIKAFFAGLLPIRIAIENGTHSAWISRILEECGHECIVANPRELRKITQSNRKNDRNDAYMLARLARVDPELLCPITHRDPSQQNDIAFIRARDALVRARTQCINTARGLVKPMGMRLPSCSPESFVKKVRKELPPSLAALLTPFLLVIASLCEQIEQYDEQIHHIAREKYPETEVLTQIYGVGTLTALAFLLTLGNPGRFEHSRDVGAYLGLVPRRCDSGDRVTQLGITKAGDKLLRRLLVGSAQFMLTRNGRDSDLRRHGLTLMERGGKNAKKRAVIAVARKLGVLMHHLWVTGSHYDPDYNQQLKKTKSSVLVTA